MILKDDTVLLRDFKREDIAKRIEWETEQTEWQLWDGPWEYEGLTEEQKKENDLPEENARGKGLATQALRLFMAYLRTLGFTELYTQTWSGNERMIGLAEKLGFTECCRKPGLRLVRGQQYDGLTFRKEL